LDFTVTSVQNIRRTQECKDDENYQDWMGLTCSDYKNVVCSQMLVVGYSHEQIDTLKQACPESCRISCSYPQEDNWKDFTSKNNLSPEAPPDYSVEEWCDDNQSYRGPLGQTCDVHAKVNCLWMSYFGYSDEQIDDLLRNCPKSCSMPCSIPPKSEEILSVNLTQGESFFPSRIPTFSPQEDTPQPSSNSTANQRQYNFTSEGISLKIFNTSILVHNPPKSKTLLRMSVPIVCIFGSVFFLILILIKITRKKQDAQEKLCSRSRSASTELKPVKPRSSEVAIIVSPKKARNNVSLEAIRISNTNKKARKVVICEEDDFKNIHSVQKNNDKRKQDKKKMSRSNGEMDVEEGNISLFQNRSKDTETGPIAQIEFAQKPHSQHFNVENSSPLHLRSTFSSISMDFNSHSFNKQISSLQNHIGKKNKEVQDNQAKQDCVKPNLKGTCNGYDISSFFLGTTGSYETLYSPSIFTADSGVVTGCWGPGCSGGEFNQGTSGNQVLNKKGRRSKEHMKNRKKRRERNSRSAKVRALVENLESNENLDKSDIAHIKKKIKELNNNTRNHSSLEPLKKKRSRRKKGVQNKELTQGVLQLPVNNPPSNINDQKEYTSEIVKTKSYSTSVKNNEKNMNNVSLIKNQISQQMHPQFLDETHNSFAASPSKKVKSKSKNTSENKATKTHASQNEPSGSREASYIKSKNLKCCRSGLNGDEQIKTFIASVINQGKGFNDLTKNEQQTLLVLSDKNKEYRSVINKYLFNR